MVVYEQKFDANEWFIIIFLIAGLILFWKLKDRFAIKEVIVYFLYSVFLAMLFDHTVGSAPYDYYDVNDNSSYQLIDFLSYLMFGP